MTITYSIVLSFYPCLPIIYCAMAWHGKFKACQQNQRHVPIMGSHSCPTCNNSAPHEVSDFADNFAPYLGCVQRGTTASNSLTAKHHRVPTHTACTWNVAVLSAAK